MYVNFLSTYSDKKFCHTSITLQTSIARFVSDSWASCLRRRALWRIVISQTNRFVGGVVPAMTTVVNCRWCNLVSVACLRRSCNQQRTSASHFGDDVTWLEWRQATSRRRRRVIVNADDGHRCQQNWVPLLSVVRQFVGTGISFLVFLVEVNIFCP